MKKRTNQELYDKYQSTAKWSDKWCEIADELVDRAVAEGFDWDNNSTMRQVFQFLNLSEQTSQVKSKS